MSIVAKLTSNYAQAGRVEWIGLRAERKQPLTVVKNAQITATGLVGDHRATPGKRAVSLIQAEHLPVIAALAGLEEVPPETLRRNIVVSGINLTALKHRNFEIGSVVLRITGPCAPCSRMEKLLGHGGYNAMRGHGGMTAEVIQFGNITVGDQIYARPNDIKS